MRLVRRGRGRREHLSGGLENPTGSKRLQGPQGGLCQMLGQLLVGRSELTFPSVIPVAAFLSECSPSEFVKDY